MVPRKPGLYVVKSDAGQAAIVAVGPAIRWRSRDGEILWAVEPADPDRLTDAEHALRGTAVRGSLSLPSGWRWSHRLRAQGGAACS